MKYGPVSTVSLLSGLCTADDIRRLAEATQAAVAKKVRPVAIARHASLILLALPTHKKSIWVRLFVETGKTPIPAHI
jgi:hypothetical protein